MTAIIPDPDPRPSCYRHGCEAVGVALIVWNRYQGGDLGLYASDRACRDHAAQARRIPGLARITYPDPDASRTD